ncbi:MAG: polysaccharide pyruvyl transferase family protein [Acetobacteraceae bacterium]
MLLYQWRGAERNFGDELNALLWPVLLPDFFDDDPGALFLGIGSVLDARHDQAVRKVVAGAGYGGYQPPPVLDARWTIHWVRGPCTARRLGLPEACGLGDPAMLLPLPRPEGLPLPSGEGGRAVGLMPHFESLHLGAWREAAAAAGMTLLDPRGDPAAILAAITGCRLLLTEAMHGAIVADALRVPWIALRPLAAVHRPKWQDWAAALGLEVRFQVLRPSSLAEWLRASPLAATHRGGRLLAAAGPVLASVARQRFIGHATAGLIAAARAPPQLSDPVALDRCRTRMQERLQTLRCNPPRAAPSALHRRATSAYHG